MTYSNGLGNLQNLLGTVAASETKRTDATATETATAAVKQGTDQTQFSSTSGVLGQALNGPDVRLPKVLALSAAIASGTYQVSSLDVAGKVIDSLLG
jgi:negative regulator of flagellin synthesis FlgM